jgi:ankyrin repeat protein
METLKYLLTSRPVTQPKDSDGAGALSGHEAIARLLLKAKAKVDAKDNNGWTALHQAALGGHEAMARLLLDAKAEVDAKGNDGWTAPQACLWYCFWIIWFMMVHWLRFIYSRAYLLLSI